MRDHRRSDSFLSPPLNQIFCLETVPCMLQYHRDPRPISATLLLYYLLQILRIRDHPIRTEMTLRLTDGGGRGKGGLDRAE